MNKKCSACLEGKDISLFSKNKRKEDGYQELCKICKSKHDKKYYSKDVKKYNKRNVRYRNNKLELIKNIFIDRKCQKCAESRWWVLDFHHIDPTLKDFNISEGKNVYKIDRIKEEISKCISLCRNCHTDFHYREKTEEITIKQYLAT